MKNYALTIGVDVSKAKLDAVITSDAASKKMIHLVVPNTPKGMSSILARIAELGISKEQVLFCFEHTGVYSIPLSVFLQQQRVDYWMVPAIEIKKSKGICRGKKDKTDARDIAIYAITKIHKLQLSTVPEDAIIELRCLLSERGKIKKAIALFESSEEGKDFIPSSALAKTLRVNKKTLTMLYKHLKEIEAELKRLVKSHPVFSRQYDLACSVPGVGPQTALYLIAFTRGFTSFSSWRKMACFAGIAPFDYESGTIKGRSKVSQLANKKLKSLFSMAAVSAKNWDPELKRYYERKRSEGKHPKSVMNAIKCKVIARVFATVNRNTPFVNTLKFAA